MICKNCETENPEEAVFCMHCGKRLDGKKYCPHCNVLNPDEAVFCIACGARFSKNAQTDPQNEAPCAQTQPQIPDRKPNEKRTASEKVKSAFDLSGGICLMVAVLFAFVFTFCMGLTVTVTSSSSSFTETTMLWDYFGDAYNELSELFENLYSYSEYFETANYIPVILSTVVCAATLICVISFTIIAAVQYGRHFKRPEVKYAKHAIAAVLSFVLGAAAFFALNSSDISQISDANIHIGFNDATTAGIVLGAIFLSLYCASRAVMLGKEFITKKAIVDFVCSIAGIIFMILVAAFAASPSVHVEVGSGKQSYGFGLNFNNLNVMISTIFSNPDKLSAEPFNNFIATYILSALAQGIQIALLVLAFVTIIKRICGFGNDSKSCLGISIATFSLAVAYLALSCIAIYFGNELMQNYDSTGISIAAAPIVALVASAFALADSITHKVLLKKTAEPQRKVL